MGASYASRKAKFTALLNKLRADTKHPLTVLKEVTLNTQVSILDPVKVEARCKVVRTRWENLLKLEYIWNTSYHSAYYCLYYKLDWAQSTLGLDADHEIVIADLWDNTRSRFYFEHIS